MSSPSVQADSLTEQLAQEVETAFARLRYAERAAVAAVRRLKAHAAALAAGDAPRLVRVKRSPPRDSDGNRIRRPRGRPKGVRSGDGLVTLYATAEQIEQLRTGLKT
jgi:hypothetical protein